jgi:sigma-B regulation protein RsbU (phosphoserine phosphatase)
MGADVSVRDVFSLKHRLEFAVRLLIVVALCAVAPIAIQAFFLRRMVGRPVKELTAAAARLGGGDLAVSLSIRTGDEIEKLADTFAKMAVRLNEYIENLTRVTAEKERIGAELDVATKIQTSMLPCIFPAFPHRAEFDIYASMQPAKEVGGDFYDFFLIDENKLAVVIADVSGKGVPAALFMVIAKTLIKNNAQYDQSPKEVFETVNNLLCENNEAGMFVTAFMGILDIPSGKFTYANAGHNPPLIKRANGQYEWLPTNPGLMLAGLEDMIYSQDEIQLDSGDILFLYTDGVTEAVDRENRFFEEPRLKDALNAYRGQDLRGLLLSIKREIDNFADGAEQADDITMLAFARR